MYQEFRIYKTGSAWKKIDSKITASSALCFGCSNKVIPTGCLKL